MNVTVTRITAGDKTLWRALAIKQQDLIYYSMSHGSIPQALQLNSAGDFSAKLLSTGPFKLSYSTENTLNAAALGSMCKMTDRRPIQII